MAYTLKGKLEEMTNALTQYGTKNYIAVTADLSDTGWKEVATHELLTITGLVKLRIIPEVTVTGDDTTGDTANIQLGHESDTDNFIGATDVDDMTEGDIWLSTTPDVVDDEADKLSKIINGVDVGYEVTGEEATAGTIVFHCWWEALSDGASVVAGDGSAMV